MNCSGCVLMMSSCHSWRSFQVCSTAGISIVVSLLGYSHYTIHILLFTLLQWLLLFTSVIVDEPDTSTRKGMFTSVIVLLSLPQLLLFTSVMLLFTRRTRHKTHCRWTRHKHS